MAKEIKKELVETMKNNNYPTAFINEKGDWLFYSRPGFEAVSRAEILGEEVEKVKPLNKMNLEELKVVANEKGLSFDDNVKKADLLAIISDNA